MITLLFYRERYYISLALLVRYRWSYHCWLSCPSRGHPLEKSVKFSGRERKHVHFERQSTTPFSGFRVVIRSFVCIVTGWVTADRSSRGISCGLFYRWKFIVKKQLNNNNKSITRSAPAQNQRGIWHLESTYSVAQCRSKHSPGCDGRLAEVVIRNACAFSHDPTVPVDFTDSPGGRPVPIRRWIWLFWCLTAQLEPPRFKLASPYCHPLDSCTYLSLTVGDKLGNDYSVWRSKPTSEVHKFCNPNWPSTFSRFFSKTLGITPNWWELSNHLGSLSKFQVWKKWVSPKSRLGHSIPLYRMFN